MGKFRVLLTAIATGAVVLVPATGASGANTFDPGDFTVTMNGGGSGPSGGQPPSINCTAANVTMSLSSYIQNLDRMWSQTAAPPAACSMVSESVQTNQALTGTVNNKNIGDGDMSQTCDMKQTLTMSFTYSVTGFGASRVPAVTDFKNVLSGFQACAWAMSFRDAQSTKLSGTVEQTFGMTSDSARIECPASVLAKMNGAPSGSNFYCVPWEMNAKVYVVGGSGYFADTGGEGSFSRADVAPIVIPGIGGVSGASAGVARALSTVMALLPQADTSQTASAMKMALLKGAKASVRLVSPAPVSGKRWLGVGPDGSTQVQVKVSAAPGAACSISAKSGSETKTLSASKKDSDGMVTTSITAATVKSKLAAKTGAKVTLSVYCKVGSKTAKFDQSVTLGA